MPRPWLGNNFFSLTWIDAFWLLHWVWARPCSLPRLSNLRGSCLLDSDSLGLSDSSHGGTGTTQTQVGGATDTWPWDRSWKKPSPALVKVSPEPWALKSVTGFWIINYIYWYHKDSSCRHNRKKKKLEIQSSGIHQCLFEYQNSPLPFPFAINVTRPSITWTIYNSTYQEKQKKNPDKTKEWQGNQSINKASLFFWLVSPNISAPGSSISLGIELYNQK